MTAPPTLPLVVECPDCRQRLSVHAEHAGRRGRCHRCGRVFLIAVPGVGSPSAPSVSSTPASTPVAAPPTPPAATTVTFPCSLCATRITTPIGAVGKTVKCPDCGRRNVIPPPPAPVVRRPPAALSGEQFELWGVDEAPTSAEIAAHTPVLHPVECRLCQTLMYATDNQVGTTLKCPDCGALTEAQARQAAIMAGPVLVPAGEEYELDETSAPTPRYVPMPVAARDAEMHARARAENTPPARGGKKPRTRDDPPPALPVLRGVAPMLLSSVILKRWTVLSSTVTVVAWFGLQAALVTSGGMGAIAGLCFLAIACILGMLWMTTAAPLWLAVITESSEGHDELQDPPQWTSYEWFAETLVVLIAAAAAAVPAWLVAKGLDATAIDPRWHLPAIAGAWLFFFPVFLLSSLNEGTPFDIISTRVLASLARCAGPWLLFFVASSAWLALGVYAVAAIGARGGILTLTLPWLAVAMTLLYMRQLGRLAWWLAEKMPPPKEPTAED